MKFKTETELNQIIGAKIKQYRTLANLTQIQLSEKAGISISYLSKLEASGCDKSLSLSTLNQIANALNIDIINFFKEDSNE